MSGLDGGSDGGAAAAAGIGQHPQSSVGGVSVTPSHVGGAAAAATALSSSSSSSATTSATTPMGVIKGSPSQYVKLNVGGSLHYTTIGTLTKHDNMLRAMFSGRMEVLSDAEGWIMLDRCGKHFGTILNFLRDGNVCLPDNVRELSELQAEAKFFCIQELDAACEKSLKSLRDKKDGDVVPICRVPLITSHKEEQALISTNSTRPIVKLLINRHNNKYSYTGASDDNILKNIELFDKLSLRFSNRVLFIKDVIGSNEICCWSFYGHGKRIAEVCCTAIVYATDRKNTKVEFPEARIYEETLNCLLYEKSTGPDLDLIAATTRQVKPCGSDDEDMNLSGDNHRGGASGGPSDSAHNARGSGSGSSSGGGGGPTSVLSAAAASGLNRIRSSKNNNSSSSRDGHGSSGNN